MRVIATRAEFPALLVELGLTGAGVEVGVQHGEHAAHILQHWPGALTVVDPWRAYGDYTDIANVSQGEQDDIYRGALVRLLPFSLTGRCQVWRLTGREASTLFAPRSLDFVYLDARHDYAAVRQDLIDWTPVMKPGGILAGHDYLDGTIMFTGFDRPTEFGVKRAVDEWAAARGWTVHATEAERFPSWYCEVP